MLKVYILWSYNTYLWLCFFFLLYQYPVCMVSRYKKLILFERHLRGDDDPDDDAKQPQRASEDLDDENLDE